MKASHFFSFLILILCLIGCTNSNSKPSSLQQWLIPNGKVKVLTTTAMIGDLVMQVGGEHADVLILIKGDLDPHSYQLVKGDDEKLSFANIIFYNGLGLEHGPSLQHHLEDNKKAISIGDYILKHKDSILKSNGQMDPHIWMDVSLWAGSVPIIVQKLSTLDPTHAEEFKKNGEVLTQKMLETHKEIKDLISAIPNDKRYLVTSHDAFNYFSRAYLATDDELKNNNWQHRFEAPEGLAPESQLSTRDIQGIIDHLTKYQIHVVFPESNISKDSIRKIIQAGKEKGLNLKIAKTPLYGDAMGPPGSDGDTYLKMVLHNARTISEYLKNNDP